MKKARNGFMNTLPYLCLVGVIALGLMTIVGTGGGGGGNGPKPSPTLPVAGEWGGSSGFGEIELVVNSDGTGIEKIGLYFDDFTCGIATFTDFTREVSGFVWDISNRQFTAQLDLGTNAYTIYIVGTFDDSGTYVSGTYEADINGTICDGDWDASPVDGPTPPTPPVAGEWGGISGFGEIELVVTQDSTGIESIVIIFDDFTCGNIISNGSITFAGSWAISNGQFTADLDWSGTLGDREMNIMGTFDDSGTFVSGTYEADYDGTICAGVWDASPE